MASPAINKTNPVLLAAKLRALLVDIEVLVDGGASDTKPGAGGGGAATEADGCAYVLHAPEIGVRSLGPALLWTVRNKLSKLVLFSDQHAGTLARRAALVSGVEVSVRQVLDATSVDALPSPLIMPPKLEESVLAFTGPMTEGGAVPVDDFGRLVGEVEGLEIVRVTMADDGIPHVEVGVGQADRELHELVHSNLSTADAIARAAALVSTHRAPNAPAHPLNRLGRARWLRSMVVSEPHLLGAQLLGVQNLRPVPPLRARETVLGSDPAAAVGDGVVVVCSAGVDPDLVPEALEYRQREQPDAELVLVLAAKDRLPTVDALIGMCADTRVVTIDPPWV